jgi:hypothetical protein
MRIKMTALVLTMSVGILDWMRTLITGSLQVAKGLTVRPWATTKGNQFLMEPDYTRRYSVRYVTFKPLKRLNIPLSFGRLPSDAS